MKPLVSVCIPTFNCARYLPSAIDSVLNQDYDNYEIIIVDNHSTDDTYEILARYAKINAKLSFFVNDKNIGMVNNWNLCLYKAKGKYVKLLCADDLLATRDALTTFVQLMEADSLISLVSSSRNVIDENGVLQIVKSPFQGNIRRLGVEIIRECLLAGRNKIGEISTVMFRREDAAGGFNVNHHNSADFELFLRLLEKGYFVFVNRPLTSFRTHSEQQTSLAKHIVGDIEVASSFSLVESYMNNNQVGFKRWEYKYIYIRNVLNLYRKYRRGQVGGEVFRKKFKNIGLCRICLYYLYFKVCKLYVNRSFAK